MFLLGTFITLLGASIRVLFYSSFENADLVIGAAAVLFIADVVSSSSRTGGIPETWCAPHRPHRDHSCMQRTSLVASSIER